MKHKNRKTSADLGNTAAIVVSRRLALGLSGAGVLALLSGSALSKTEEKKPQTKPSVAKPPKEFQERVEQSKTFMERLHNAKSMEERQEIMNEQMAWQRQTAIDDLKQQLGLSDKEWSVVRPRLQAVYDLVHPRPRTMGRDEQPKTEVEQMSQALRELLREERTAPDQIKAALTTLRAARERTVQHLVKARQSLRQLMSLRQEALLVLNGLLD